MPKIVFVVGAGASNEFGLPTGDSLKEAIASCVKISDQGYNIRFGDNGFHALIRPLFTDNEVANRHVRAARLISDNMVLAPSIDNFVDTHRDRPEVATVAKLAIAKCIIQAEASSALFVDQSNAYNSIAPEKVKDSWLAELFKALVAQRDFGGFIRILKNIYFISFNYDRCIHQFFFFSAKRYFDLDEQGALSVMTSLNVIYPYGTVGSLRYDDAVRTGYGVFEAEKMRLAALTNLKTFTEGADSGFSSKAAKIIEGADRVFFLGFGYIQLNMKIVLSGGHFCVGGVYGTCKGLSVLARNEVTDQLKAHFFRKRIGDTFLDLDGRIVIEPITCSQLIWDHSRFFAGL